ncbi:hypothetical protein EDB89DRAFT_1498988 [Lactarius sanguifluus]|nr:hypothetical protein EDB89DRAFT_1498988 [Lactarius sanguifluus]
MGVLRLARRFEFARVARNESVMKRRANRPNGRKRVSGECWTDEGVSMLLVIPGSHFLAHAHPRTGSMYPSSGPHLPSTGLVQVDLLRSPDNGWVTRPSVMKYVHICQLLSVSAQAVPSYEGHVMLFPRTIRPHRLLFLILPKHMLDAAAVLMSADWLNEQFVAGIASILNTHLIMNSLCIHMTLLFSLAIPCGMHPCCGVHPLPALFVPRLRGVLPPDYLPAARVFSCESTGCW